MNSLTVDNRDIESSFLVFAESHGFVIPEPLEMNREIPRFKIEGEKRGGRSGAYCVWTEGRSFDGKPHGWVQDHHEGGEKYYWQFYNRDNPSSNRRYVLRRSGAISKTVKKAF
jgi:hypothetical protein